VPNAADDGSTTAVGPGGEVYVTYLHTEPGGSFQAPAASIEVVKSTDGGLTFSAPVLVAPVHPIGFDQGSRFNPSVLNGNFPVRSFPRLDVSQTSGQVYIVFASNPGNGDTSDVFLTSSSSGGATWSQPVRLNDDETLNDQFFPAVAVNGSGAVEAIWYDRRLDSANLQIDVFKARSTDGGASFAPNQRVTSVSFRPTIASDSPSLMGDFIDIKARLEPTGRTQPFYLAWGDTRRIIVTKFGACPDLDVRFLKDE
jgi:hypothetical protein